jgi:hypothetical protein
MEVYFEIIILPINRSQDYANWLGINLLGWSLKEVEEE